MLEKHALFHMISLRSWQSFQYLYNFHYISFLKKAGQNNDKLFVEKCHSLEATCDSVSSLVIGSCRKNAQFWANDFPHLKFGNYFSILCPETSKKTWKQGMLYKKHNIKTFKR